jgi:hypothetical protein
LNENEHDNYFSSIFFFLFLQPMMLWLFAAAQALSLKEIQSLKYWQLAANLRPRKIL